MSSSTVPAGFGEAGLEEESGKLHPLSSAQEMEDGLQDSTEERAGKGLLEESLDGPFGLLSWAVDSLQLADLLGWHFLFGLCAAGFIGCPVPSLMAQLGVVCLIMLGRSGSSAMGDRGRWVSVPRCMIMVPGALTEPPSKSDSIGRRWCRILKSCPSNERMSAGAS